MLCVILAFCGTDAFTLGCAYLELDHELASFAFVSISSGNVCNVQEGLGCSGLSKSFFVDYLPGYQALAPSFFLRLEDNY